MGDLFLQKVAQRLRFIVREGDTVARLGGDEFVVMLEDLRLETFESVIQAEMIGNKVLIVLNQFYQLGIHKYHCTASIGITLFNGHEHSVEELLKQADIAMYQAKASGRNALCLYDSEMAIKIAARAELEADLHVALAESQFDLYYQPQVCHNQLIIGAEALIRWQHPLRGLVFPGDFIPLAEESELIVSIGHWVLEQACAQLKIWEDNEYTQNLQLSVNVSARQFYQVDFVKQVSEVLSRNDVNPAKLKLELTETMVLKNIDDIIFKMKALHEMGVLFSIDDFGTGHSSLSTLKKLPFNQLKIDQSFVRDISIDPDDAVIVKSIIVMADSLGLDVIAEGVETEAQRVFLEQNNCLTYQGYLFSKPLPIEQFELMLKR
jgi:predicted signal transduction protein with EAL and GGDEF domain